MTILGYRLVNNYGIYPGWGFRVYGGVAQGYRREGLCEERWFVIHIGKFRAMFERVRQLGTETP